MMSTKLHSKTTVSRRMSTLHKMVDAASVNAEGVTWNHVLHYLKAHCQMEGDDDDESDNSTEERLRTRKSNNRKKASRNSTSCVKIVENPLPDYYVATAELKKELWIDKSKGDSLLRACLPSAPPKIVATLCFLHPEALRTPDAHNRLALHYACRYPVSERLDSSMKVLIDAYPSALFKRDNDGRTPLHYLFWYHAEDRSPPIVSAFCRNLSSFKQEFFKLRQPLIQELSHQIFGDTLNTQQQHEAKELQKRFPLPEIPRPSQSNRIPINAAVIPDSTHGCLPLHYAVMEGASFDAIQILYQTYPQSKNCIDRYGRTPLHWYLGAGTLDFWSQDTSVPPQHVSGEIVQLDPNLQNRMVRPSHNRLINPDIVQILISSRVARTADFQQRYPLHWAASFLAHNYKLSDRPGCAMSLQIVKLLLDNFVGQLICFDDQKMTPAMLLFDTVNRIQLHDWTNKRSQPSQFDLIHGGSSKSLFDPPMELLEMLLKHPDPTANANVAAMEDAAGRLPVHVALEVASSPECVALLIKCHPTALIHTAEDTLFVPLHSAFCHQSTAPLQTTEIITLLLQSIQAGRYGTVVDGRLAMKMEDSLGYYPIHFAIQNGACLDVIKTLVHGYPNTALVPTPSGNLPIHCLLTDELILDITSSGRGSFVDLNGSTDETVHTCNVPDETNRGVVTKLHKVVQEKMYILLRPLLSDPSKLAVADSNYGMLPLHCAVLFDAVDYPLLLRMLELNPSSATKFTKPHRSDSIGSSSVLDLHEMRRPYCTIAGNVTSSDWLRKRELLFSFHPTLESHRHREELLDQCVRLIIDEIGETNSLQDKSDSQFRFHLKAMQTMNDKTMELELSHSVSNMEKAVLKSFGFKQSRAPRHVSYGPISPKSDSGSLTRARSRSNSHTEDSNKKSQKQKQKKGRKYVKKTNSSSVYDDESTSFGAETYRTGYETGEGDETEGSLFSGVESDDVYSSEVDDSNDDSDATDSDGEVLSGDPSRSFGNTSSGSRLRTTFEEGSYRSSDDEGSRTYNDDESRSYTCTDETGTRQTYDDEESTVLTRLQTPESDRRKKAFHSTGSGIAEEKKDDCSFGNEMKAYMNNKTPKAGNNGRRQQFVQSKPSVPPFQQPSYISEVALRLWSFFILYCDPHNPNDNYVKQVSDIIDEIKFSTVEKMVSIPLPPYATQYFDAKDWETLNFRDVASPKCRELLHKTCYFVGRYDLHLQQLQQEENNISILVQRSASNSTVTIRALEWMFTTEEQTVARDPGVAVQNIWATGEFPAEVGVTFKSLKRPVWIKFTKDKDAYENEVSKRNAIGIAVEDTEDDQELCYNFGIAPLLSHYNAFNTERKKDRTYHVDINDERFNVVKLFAGECNSYQSQLHLNEYPYALVYPASILGSPMSDYINRTGLSSINSTPSVLVEENRRLCSTVALTIANMHERDIVHASICLDSIATFPDYKEPTKNRPLLIDLSRSLAMAGNTPMFLGGISSQGYPQFKTDTLPPEMFVRLSPQQLQAYTDYWNAVEEMFHVKIDKDIIEPIVDIHTSDRYVVKCHFIPLTQQYCQDSSTTKNIAVDKKKVPCLPYDLIPASPSADLWAIGQLMFLLWTGKTVLKVDTRRDSSMNYSNLINWTSAEHVVYEYVNDPIAQDILLVLLANKNDRDKIQLENILMHPFFVGVSDSSSLLVKQINDKRKVDWAAYKREQRTKAYERYENEWVNHRTRTVTCWDFTILERMYVSPSQIVHTLTVRKNVRCLPTNFILLPYKLSPNTYLTEEEKNIATRIGEDLLYLSKSCYFTSVMQQATSTNQEEHSPHKWSSSEMLRVLDLSSDEFGEIQNEMANLAAKHVEIFRTNPMSVAMKLVQKRVTKLHSSFTNEKLYLYVIDEFSNTPILSDPFPVNISDDKRECIFQNCLLLMHLCFLHARGVSKDLSGMTKILFNDDANFYIPPTWTNISRGLNHQLDEAAFVKEVQMLENTISDMYSTKHILADDVYFIQNYLLEVDPSRILANLQRVVVSGGAWLWTTPNEADGIEEKSKNITFKDALYKSRMVDANGHDVKLKLDKTRLF